MIYRGIKNILHFFLLCLLSLTICISYSKVNASEIEDMLNAHGYVLGQNHALDFIQKKFPDIKEYSLYCKNIFLQSSLGKGWQSIKLKLQEIDNNEISLQTRIDNEIENLDKKLYSSCINKLDAQSFCDEVLERSSGNVPEKILTVLLQHNPEYFQTPAKELFDGWYSEYRTKGNPKAGPLDFTISFPKTWKIKRGNRPHILNSWSRKYENFFIVANIQVTVAPQLAAFPDREVYSYLRSDNSFTDWVPEGGRLISGEHYTIEGIPFMCVSFDAEIKRLDFSSIMRSTLFLSYYNGHIFQINFHLSNNENELDKIQKKMFPLYKAIMNTLVINNQYYN